MSSVFGSYRRLAASRERSAQRRWRMLIMSIAVLAALAGCRDNDGPFASSARLTDIAEVVDAPEGGSRFAVMQGEDSEPAILYAPDYSLNDTDFPVGSRLLLIYHYPDPATPAYSSGNITVDAVAKINNDLLRVDPIADHPEWDSSPVYLYAVWRSGNFINVHSRLTYSTSSRQFMLMVDKPTVDDDFPDLYLVHDIHDAPDSFTRQNYASFDISSLWKRKSCKGVRVNIASTNIPQKSFIFNKPQ